MDAFPRNLHRLLMKRERALDEWGASVSIRNARAAAIEPRRRFRAYEEVRLADGRVKQQMNLAR